MNTRPSRYAHDEGLVGLCYDDDGEHIITCGSEGDVRIFQGFEDDDPMTHRVGDSVYTVAYKNYRFYTAADDNAVQIRIFKEGETDGILTRCTAPVNTLTFNKSGSQAFTGSSDFAVKIVNIEESSERQALEHEAPVLCVVVNPQETLLASSSCDGTVRIYSFNQSKVIKTLTGLPKSNDISTSLALGRICWSKTGQLLFVPVDKEVKAYNTDSWNVDFSLTDNSVNQQLSVTCLSPCGKYLAASSIDGQILVFDIASKTCIAKDQHAKKWGLTGLVWKPKGGPELAWVDNHGNLGLYEDFIPKSAPINKDQLSVDQIQDLFEDADDDMLVQASGVAPGNSLPDDSDSDDDDNDITQTHNRSRVTRILDDDQSSVDGASVSEKAESVSSLPVSKPPVPVIGGFEPTPLQKPFQSSSTPAHFAHRFMVWNSVGVILQFNTEDENSINVEFHDTATHHALHVPNTLGHSMADLSTEAVLLACEPDEDTPSKVVCMHFSSWDSCKEWSVPMPDGEEILAICLGEGWAAVATDRRMVRMFSIGGLQKEVFSLPGPVVAMAGHTNQLLVTYHRGMGIPGDQCLGVRLITVSGRKRTVISGDDLPVSRKSTLAWLGFSAEGTPFTVDTAGIVRMLNRKFGNNWVEAANLKSHTKGKSDNYWVVGIHENPQQLRAILCKGSRYPVTLPRPNVSILPFQLPLCELSTDKGSIEESLARERLMTSHLDWLSTQGYEVDSAAKSQADLSHQEALMKLFALACKTSREFRAVEICELMPSSHTVQLAIKYASRMRLGQLSQRLMDVASNKSAEEAVAEETGEVSDDEEDVRKQLWCARRASTPAVQEEDMDEDADDVDMAEEAGEMEGDLVEELEQEERAGPMLKFKANKEEKTTTPKAITLSQAAKKNPFKVGSQKTPSTGQGSRVFDNMESRTKSASKLQKSPDPLAKRPRIKPKSMEQKKNSSVTRIFGNKKETTEKPASVRVSGFQLWFAENKADLQEEHPDLDDTDLTKTAARAFKELTAEVKKIWNDKAADTTGEEDTKKRKREIDEENVENTDIQTKMAKKDTLSAKDSKKTPLSNSHSKLASFAFNKM